MTVWENKNFYIVKHESKLPWLKLFTKIEYKELTDIPKDIKSEMYELLEVIETALINYYNPDKINLASFGNMLPRIHWHIIARFQNDPWFPKTTWEEPPREYKLNLPNFEEFAKLLKADLDEYR